MNKLAVALVAIFVAVVAAAPNSLLAKSLEQVKRAATLLQPLQPIHKQEKRQGEGFDVLVFDTDNDNMLNVDELKALLIFTGVPKSDLDDYVKIMMMGDVDKNQKLDMTEMEELFKWPE